MKQPYGILTKTSFLRAITKAQENRFARGGPSGSAIIPFLDSDQFGAAVKRLREASAAMGALAAPKPTSVEGWRPCVSAFGEMVAAQDAVNEHFRRLQNRVIAALDSTKQARADNKADKGKSRVRLPRNTDVIRLAKKINDEFDVETSEMSIALQFTGGDEKHADTLLRQLRRFPDLRRRRKK
jgi:hypothetical protein